LNGDNVLLIVYNQQNDHADNGMKTHCLDL